MNNPENEIKASVATSPMTERMTSEQRQIWGNMNRAFRVMTWEDEPQEGVIEAAIKAARQICPKAKIYTSIDLIGVIDESTITMLYGMSPYVEWLDIYPRCNQKQAQQIIEIIRREMRTALRENRPTRVNRLAEQLDISPGGEWFSVGLDDDDEDSDGLDVDDLMQIFDELREGRGGGTM